MREKKVFFSLLNNLNNMGYGHVSEFVMPCGRLVGEALTSWLSFKMSNCDVVTFPLVSWDRCGASL